MIKIDMPMDVIGIMKLIPHRHPFLLLDTVEELLPGERAVGVKNVTINEDFFCGHFPNKPIMPGVLILEAMAQTAAVLVAAEQQAATADKLVYFTSIESARFTKPVVPGDSLYLHVKKVGARLNLWKIYGEAMVKGNKVSEAHFSAMLVENK